MKKRNRTLAALSNYQLIRKGDHAVRTRHELAIEILDCLIEIEQRELHLEEGYSSLFDFCTRRWHYSPPKAGRTIATARCVKNFPTVRSLLLEQKITVCGVARIAGILTDENSENLLREISGKKYVEIDKIAASLRTAPAIREFVRPIGVKKEPVFPKSNYQINSGPGTDQAPPIGIDAAPHPASIEEKPENRYEIRFSASDRFLRKLNRAKAICSQCPGLEAVLEKALDELLERHDPERKEARREKRKSVLRDQSGPVSTQETPPGKTPTKSHDHSDCFRPDHTPVKPDSSSGHSRMEISKRRSRHIPAGIRDAVFRRDDGRCTYVGKNGVRCKATVHLQIDHIRPFCRGGEHTIDNLRLLCGKHNRLVARKLAL